MSPLSVLDRDLIARRAPLVVLAASIAVLGGALGLQYLGGLAPCPLCLWQRWPYVAAIALSGVALLIGGAPLRGLLLGLCAAAFLTGAGLAAYHVGVEQGWVAPPGACTGAALDARTVEELRRQLMAAPVVRCDEVPWALFGVSLAGWNLVASIGLALASLAAASSLLGRGAGRAR